MVQLQFVWWFVAFYVSGFMGEKQFKVIHSFLKKTSSNIEKDCRRNIVVAQWKAAAECQAEQSDVIKSTIIGISL